MVGHQIQFQGLEGSALQSSTLNFRRRDPPPERLDIFCTGDRARNARPYDERNAQNNRRSHLRARDRRLVSRALGANTRYRLLRGSIMRYSTDRPYSDPDTRRLLDHARAFEPVQDGRIYIEKINGPFLFKEGGTPPTTRLALSSPLRAAGSGNAGPAPM